MIRPVNRAIIASAFLLTSLAVGDVAVAEGLLGELTQSCIDGSCLEPCQSDCAQCSYGPCDCIPRKTLMQWSYGTSFGGNPDLSEPIITDRPDFTEASSTVGRGIVQLEMGYTYFADNDGTEQLITHTYPELLARIGMFADWFELRVAYTTIDERSSISGRSVGAADLYIGAKIGLTPQEGILPEMAIIPQAFVPAGSAAFRTNEFLPGVNWLYSWEINDFISTGGSSQFNRLLDDVTGQPFLMFAQSWTIAYSFTDCLGGFTEWFVLVPDGADTAQTENYFNGGFTYLMTSDLQLDIRGGLGLNQAAADSFVGAGLSVRF